MNNEKINVKRAIVSVYNKTGLEKLIPCLTKHNIEIISSGGTAKAIRSMGYKCTDISSYTGYPESPDGLVKTLQPKIHGGLLLNPDDPYHNEFMKIQGILPIDMAVVNLYPFTKTAENPDSSDKQVCEMIDIGGPAMIRASGKGALLHGRPCVVVEPKDYDMIIAELTRTNGFISTKLIKQLAVKAFEHTARYDKDIVKYLYK